MTARPTVTFEDRTYSLRSSKTEIPDLASMTRLHALVWLNRHTVARGYSRKGAEQLPGITLEVR